MIINLNKNNNKITANCIFITYITDENDKNRDKYVKLEIGIKKKIDIITNKILSEIYDEAYIALKSDKIDLSRYKVDSFKEYQDQVVYYLTFIENENTIQSSVSDGLQETSENSIIH